jgi:hypothetical protein
VSKKEIKLVIQNRIVEKWVAKITMIAKGEKGFGGVEQNNETSKSRELQVEERRLL